MPLIMVAQLHSATFLGIEGIRVDVEVDVARQGFATEKTVIGGRDRS